MYSAWMATEEQGKELFLALTGDIHRILVGNPELKTGEPIDFSLLDGLGRRSFVRAVFAFAEAMTFFIKHYALEFEEARTRLSGAEIAMCKEESCDLSERGEVIMRPAKIRFLANVRFAFQIVAKIWELDFQVRLSGRGWEAMRKAVKVRDRLMHPKSPADLVVSDEEVGLTWQAYVWFQVEMMRLLICQLDSQRGKRKELEELIRRKTMLKSTK